MGEMWERISQHKKDSEKYSKKNLAIFKAEISKGKYPKKCLDCYSLGINYCIFWEKNFGCEEFEIKKIEELVKDFE